MAILLSNHLTLHIGYHSITNERLIRYYLRLLWKDQPLINPAICKHNMDGDAFLFTLNSFDPEETLLSFFEQLLDRRQDARLQNFVEPDTKFVVYTWSGKLPYLKDKYGETINVGRGMESFNTGIQKLAERNSENLELVIRIPQSHFTGGMAEGNNWTFNQYSIVAIETKFRAIELLCKELAAELETFKNRYPGIPIVKESFRDPFE